MRIGCICVFDLGPRIVRAILFDDEPGSYQFLFWRILSQHVEM